LLLSAFALNSAPAAVVEPPMGCCAGEDRISPDDDLSGVWSPDDWQETSDGTTAPPSVSAAALSGFAPSSQQRVGALSGKVVFMNSGHGWTWDSGFSPPWRLQRGIGNSMNEDYGNLDQLNFFAAYCFNAGATVVSMRPLGHQTNEVILDNDDAAVTWAGAWTDSASTIFWGNPGDLPYRFASYSASETASATYAPTIPVAGMYPVYCWTRHGTDRGDQLYRIRHTGGESQIRIPHHMVGNGWIYLGEYHFNAGSNSALASVVISNLRGSAQGSVVIADAIRFGNGMGSVDQGGGVSGYPREDESMRYWIKANLGQGQSTTLYEGLGDDESDSWSAPPKMSAEMNRSDVGDIYDRIHISFHSNAGGGRGTVALITSDPTPRQAELANIAGGEVNDDLVALGAPPLEFAWFNKATHTYTGGYGEIDGSTFNYEMPATIIEVAFHDDATDAAIMRDAKARSAVGKAAMHAVVKFMNMYDTNGAPPLLFLPEPPSNLRALAANTNGHITLTWSAPVNFGGSQAATNYVLYRSTNGYGFGNPVSVGNVTLFIITNLPPNTDHYFRVTAANGGGESMPSETVGCRASSTSGAARVLVVNGFDRFERTTNLKHDVNRGVWDPQGNSGAIERVFPRWINAGDYVVPHGKAVASAGFAFDACQNEAIINNQVALTNYNIVIWACGNETIGDETFSSTEQTKITAYLAGGGAMFASGADIAYDLDRASGPTSGDRAFLNSQLHTTFSNDNSASYTAAVAPAGIFAARSSATVDNGNFGIYWVQTPDVLSPLGAGASAALNYSGGTGGAAAIQYDGSTGGGRTVVFGFPFETIRDDTRRNQYMSDILGFLSLPAGTNLGPSLLAHPVAQIVTQGSNATFAVIASGTPPLSYQWRFNGVEIPGATSSSYTRSAAQPAHSGNYSVIVSNAFSIVTSSNALLQIMLPLQLLFADNFDVDSSANWQMTRSSADCRVTHFYNYSTYGIPSAPSSTGGTTRGVKFEANVSLGVAAAINISPIGQNFGGNYRLRFDLWINANGPFPAGGTGSTQHGTAGVGTAGNRTQWSGAGSTADGVWFAADGEGQASDATPDFRAQIGASLQASNSGVYAAGLGPDARRSYSPYYATTFPGGQIPPVSQGQSGSLAAGTIGFVWRDVIVSKTDNVIEWTIDGLRIATITNTLTSSNIFIGYYDTFNSLSSNTNLSFGMFDNVRVERFVTNIPPYFTMQPVPAQVVAGSNHTFTATAGGSAALSYQWRQNGTNIPGATGSAFQRLNAAATDTGGYAVVVTNAFGSVTSTVATLTVLLPPVITSQPQPLTLKAGTNATFSVSATGDAPLDFQWRFNGADISGATASSYTRSNVTLFDGGNYSVVVGNSAGDVVSTNALLSVTPLLPLKFDWISVQPDQRLRVVLSGEPGVYALQVSSNLVSWITMTNLTNAGSSFEYLDDAVTNRASRFYRATQ
jgi:hypothetical protein